MNAIFNILSLAFWYGFVWKKVAHLLGVRYISIADLLASAKTKVVAAVDNLDPEYCCIAYKVCRVSQGIAGVVAVYNFFATRGNILDHAFGLIAFILFIVGMNKVCKRITKHF